MDGMKLPVASRKELQPDKDANLHTNFDKNFTTKELVLWYHGFDK